MGQRLSVANRGGAALVWQRQDWWTWSVRPEAFSLDARIPAAFQAVRAGINHPEVPTFYGPARIPAAAGRTTDAGYEISPPS